MGALSGLTRRLFEGILREEEELSLEALHLVFGGVRAHEDVAYADEWTAWVREGLGVDLRSVLSGAGSLQGPALAVTVGLLCVAFYVAYQQFENYVVYPRVMRRAVDVPAPVTVVAALLGGTLLGIVGALIAIPVAAAVLLVVRQVTMPRMDRV